MAMRCAPGLAAASGRGTAERAASAGGRIRRRSQRLQEFEIRYGLSTADFIQRYENDELEDLRFAHF